MQRKLPKAIVIYRDGVSEGEYSKVQQEEISKIDGEYSYTRERLVRLTRHPTTHSHITEDI